MSVHDHRDQELTVSQQPDPYPVRLIAVDMDGTLLTDDKIFDRQRLERILVRMQRHNMSLVIASGNTYAKLQQYMQGFEHRGLIYIAENGAYIADDSGQLAVHPLIAEDLPHVYELLQQMPQLGVVVCTPEGSYVARYQEQVLMRVIRDYFHAQGKPVPEDLDPYEFAAMFYPGAQRIQSYEQVQGDPIKFSLQVPHAQMAASTSYLREFLPETVTPLVSGFGAIDLVRTGVNKATALADLCEKLQITPAQILAFGDSDNDLEMLSFAGTGVAMEQSSPELKAVAQQVIGSHNDGAVLDYMERMLDEADRRANM